MRSPVCRTYLLMRSLLTACAVLMMTGIGGHAHAQTDNTVYDEHVSVMSFADMTYPATAMATGLEGAVVVAVTLNDDGSVREAAAVSGHKLLIPDSLTNARKWTFAPNPQRRAIIVYDFTIEGTCHGSGQVLFRRAHFNQAKITTCMVVS